MMWFHYWPLRYEETWVGDPLRDEKVARNRKRRQWNMDNDPCQCLDYFHNPNCGGTCGDSCNG